MDITAENAGAFLLGARLRCRGADGTARRDQRIGYRVREMRVVNNAGRRVAGFGTEVFSELTDGLYVTLQRSGLSRLLFERLNGRVESMFGDGVIALEEQADRVRVQLEHGGERRFDLVIGADGLHSSVRKLVFGPQSKFEKHLGYAVAAFEANGASAGQYAYGEGPLA